MAKSIKEQILMTTDDRDRLKKEAKKQGRSRSNLGRKYIIDGLKKDEDK